MSTKTDEMMGLAEKVAEAYVDFCANDWGASPGDGQALEDARAALRSAIQEVVSGWLPIETAPKDGSDVLLTNGCVVHEGHWLHAEGGTIEHRDLDGRYIGQDDTEGFDGWIDWGGGMLPEPTHWKPLPEPPEAS